MRWDYDIEGADNLSLYHQYRAMVSNDTMKELKGRKFPYILSVRMRKVKKVFINGNRHILCLNTRQASKEGIDRKAMIANKGYRGYLKLDHDATSINQKKIDDASRFDGKWVLKTNTHFPSEKIALKYKELLQVEQTCRDVKSVLDWSFL